MIHTNIAIDWLIVGLATGVTADRILYTDYSILSSFGMGWLYEFTTFIAITATVFIFGITLAKTIEGNDDRE